MQLQKEVKSNPKQPICKKSVQPQKGHCEKMMWNPRCQPRNGCEGKNNGNSGEFGAKS